MKALITSDVASAWDELPADLKVVVCAPEPQAIAAALDETVEILASEVLPAGEVRAPGLRWVQLLSAGADQLVGHPLARRELAVCTAAGLNAVQLAEYVVACVLDHHRGMGALRGLQRAGEWPADRMALARPALRELRALVVGYGAIGRETARLLYAFGVTVVAVASRAGRRPYGGFTPYPDTGDPEATLPERVVGPEALHAELPAADLLILALPLLPKTRALIDRRALGLLKPTAALINVGRGALVDTQALLEALDRGGLAHAYLDVFEQEPLSAHSPLWGHARVSLTPHIAGTLPDHDHRLQALFLANLARYRAGQPLLNQLELRLYR